MTKKWNLQDIRPIQKAPSSRTTLPRQNPDQPRSVKPVHHPSETQAISNSSRRNREQSNNEIDHTESSGDDFNSLPAVEIADNQKKSKHYLLVAIVLFLVSVSSAYGIGTLTAGAEITIYPKVRSMNVNAEFSAYKEKRSGELSYEVLTLEATGERQVKATGQEEVSIQTVGEIEIYKSTPGTERLIKNTRFATADGKIFRIQESVVLPGALKGADGTLKPGVIRAQVFADEAGEAYNIPAKSKLTVPGFKENNFTELYNAIYAENPVAFSGGFKGPRFIINDEELATAKQALQIELRDTLRAKITNERPANYTLFLDSIAITYNSLPPAQYGDSLVTIKEQAILQIPLFNNDDFASFIAKETIIGYELTDKVRIDNVNSLAFSYSNPATTATNIANLESLTFKVVGQPVIVWTYNEEGLKQALVGKEKTALPLALSQYTRESKSTLKIRPFWKSTFPEDAEKITVTEILEIK